MFIKIMEKKIVIILGVFLLAIAFSGPIVAHPGHGEVIEEEPSPSGGTHSGSSGSSSTSSHSSSSSGYTSNSRTSYYHDTSSGVTQSNEARTTQAQTTDPTVPTATQNEYAPEEVSDTSGSNDSASGPIAMIGLMVVIGLIAMSFPYTEGGTLHNLQIRLLGR